MSAGQLPLLDVLTRAFPGGFTPKHPQRRPWHQPTLGHVEVAFTGVVAVVPLEIADRVELHGLGRPSWEQDWDCPEDWTRQSWGVAPVACKQAP